MSFSVPSSPRPRSAQIQEVVQHVEAALRDGEARVQAIVELAADAIISIDSRGTIESFNPAAAKMFGYAAEDIIGQNIKRLMPNPFRDEHDGYLARYLTTGEKRVIGIGREALGQRKDGSTFPMELDVNELRLGEKRMFTGIVRDITERKKAEAELHDSMQELAESQARFLEQTTLLQRQNAELQEAMQRANHADTATAAKSEFLANMSHEIRTPMTAILGFSDILVQTVQQPECIEAVQTIKRNGEYLLEIINDILDLSKIEAGKLEIERIACSPSQVVSEIMSLMRVRAEAKGLALDAEYRGPIPEQIISDPTRLRQSLLNLVGNAIKFTERGGVAVRVRLDMAENGEPLLRFEVRDSGIGMSQAQIGRLFRPFTQADTTVARKFGGSGLGLTICQRLIKMLGGTIDVKSTLGEGSTISMTVATGPLQGVRMFDGQSEAFAEACEKPPVVEQTTCPQLECRVLLAEDGPDNQRLISFALKKAGATVEVAENGLLAVQRMLETSGIGHRASDFREPIDLVLMDMQMPVMDGYEATRRLRKAGFKGPIVALTAHAMSGDRERCLAVGCTDYATKPIDRNQLVRLIAGLVHAPEPLASVS